MFETHIIGQTPSSLERNLVLFYFLSNAMHGIRRISNHLSVCLSVCVSVCPQVVCPQYRPWFLSDLPQIWNVGHTCDNEDNVRWPITPEVVDAHARQFISGLAHFKSRVHDSAPISCPTDFNHIWYVDLFCQEQEQVLSATQPEVIYAHVRNLTLGFLLKCS